VTQQAETMKKRFAQRPDPKAEAQMHAPERMAQQLAQMQEHLKDMQALRDRVADLYAVLTPAQQTLADQHFARMGREARAHGTWHGAGMGHPGPMGPGPARATAAPTCRAERRGTAVCANARRTQVPQWEACGLRRRNLARGAPRL
jgi:hypothetical protein